MLFLSSIVCSVVVSLVGNSRAETRANKAAKTKKHIYKPRTARRKVSSSRHKVSLARTPLGKISVTFHVSLIKSWCLQECVCCNKEVFCWVHSLEDGRKSGKEQVMRHSGYYRRVSNTKDVSEHISKHLKESEKH